MLRSITFTAVGVIVGVLATVAFAPPPATSQERAPVPVLKPARTNTTSSYGMHAIYVDRETEHAYPGRNSQSRLATVISPFEGATRCEDDGVVLRCNNGYNGRSGSY